MGKSRYLLALMSYLAIPVVGIAAGVVYSLIDPEWAVGTNNYERNFHLLQWVRGGVMLAGAGLACLLWLACCYFVITSRQRSPGWLLLAAAGPFGFAVIAALEDAAPTPADLYQRFMQRLKIYWRVPLEVALFVAIWTVAYELMVVKRDLMIHYQSFMTRIPVEVIIAEQDASSGMYAFGEGLQVMYLVILIYLLWPIFFNFAGHWFKRSNTPQPATHSSA